MLINVVDDLDHRNTVKSCVRKMVRTFFGLGTVVCGGFVGCFLALCDLFGWEFCGLWGVFGFVLGCFCCFGLVLGFSGVVVGWF